MFSIEPPRRIALIHALRDSIEPIRIAFARHWPAASTFNLLDDSLSNAVADEGKVTDAIVRRFLVLGRYAQGSQQGGRPPDAILFTCSAFGSAIDAVERDLPLPVLRPNEAAFERALAQDRPIHLLVTFPPSLASLTAELRTMAAKLTTRRDVCEHIVEGAFEALQAGNRAEHDRRVARAAARYASAAVVVLGQFSMAAAAEMIDPSLRNNVLTTPDCAVNKLRLNFERKVSHGP